MKKIRRAEISIAVGLIVSIIVSMTGFGYECKSIREDVVRLHILANSDSEADQNIKLAVRDALLESGSEIFSGTVNKENAAEYLEKHRDGLKEKANSVLKEKGVEYEAEIYLTEEYFNTRVYESFTLPAGKYLALKVVLGKGEGHNWWCVMFPPLCLPAATEKTDLTAVFGNNGAEIVENSYKYEIRFKVIEVFEELKSKLFT